MSEQKSTTTTKISADDPAIQQYIELDKKYQSEIKPFFEALAATKDYLEETYGTGVSFQDADGTVYETVRPDWKSVPMEHFAINRTKREGETKGTLSVVRARELGYEIS